MNSSTKGVVGQRVIVVILAAAVVYVAFGKRRPSSVIRAHSTDATREIDGGVLCGPACLYLIAKQQGIPHSLDELRQRTNVSAFGTSMLALKETAEELGFRATPYEATFSNLRRLIMPDGSYAILHVEPDHFVVALTSFDNAIVRIADPGRGLIDVNESGLQDLYAWDGTLLLIERWELP